MDLKQHIRNIPDFPKPGIMFRDITPMLANPQVFGEVIHRFAERFRAAKPTAILAAESRGFIFAAPLALALPELEGLAPVGGRGAGSALRVGLADGVGVGVPVAVPVGDAVGVAVRSADGLCEGVAGALAEAEPVFDGEAPAVRDALGDAEVVLDAAVPYGEGLLAGVRSARVLRRAGLKCDFAF